MQLSHPTMYHRKSIVLVILAAVVAGGCVSRPIAGDAKPVSTQLVRDTRSWDGAALPPYPAGQPEVRILRITIPAGARLPSHRHPVINAGVLVRGRLDVVASNGQTLSLKAGDPIVEVVGTWHYGYNPGDSDAEIIVFYAGAPDAAITEYQPVTGD